MARPAVTRPRLSEACLVGPRSHSVLVVFDSVACRSLVDLSSFVGVVPVSTRAPQSDSGLSSPSREVTAVRRARSAARCRDKTRPAPVQTQCRSRRRTSSTLASSRRSSPQRRPHRTTATRRQVQVLNPCFQMNSGSELMFQAAATTHSSRSTTSRQRPSRLRSSSAIPTPSRSSARRSSTGTSRAAVVVRGTLPQRTCLPLV